MKHLIIYSKSCWRPQKPLFETDHRLSKSRPCNAVMVVLRVYKKAFLYTLAIAVACLELFVPYKN